MKHTTQLSIVAPGLGSIQYALGEDGLWHYRWTTIDSDDVKGVLVKGTTYETEDEVRQAVRNFVEGC